MAKVRAHTRVIRGRKIKVKGHHRRGKNGGRHRKPKHHRFMKSRRFRSKMREMMRGVYRKAGTRRHRRRR